MQYKIITDHPNTNTIRMKLLFVKNGLSYTTKTLFDSDQKAKAKLMGIRSFPTAYTKDNQQIGGLEELESWINHFEK